jgi:phosphate transport system protein
MLSRKMVSDSLKAFVNHDQQLAIQVARDDDAVDDLCDELQAELINRMRNDPSLVEQATRLLLVARVLERTADHATNIVEQIYYVETGDMRQLGREEHAVAVPSVTKMQEHHDTESEGRDADIPMPSVNGGAPGVQSH